MIEAVEQRCRHRHGSCSGKPGGFEGQRQPKAYEDDADVLDRRIGKHAFQIIIKHGVKKAEHRRRGAQKQEGQGPPPDRCSQQVEDDADDAVDRDLGHDAAHQGGDMAGSCRMGQRQPGVQRCDAGLRSGAENGTGEDEPGNERAGWRGADRVEGVIAGSTCKSTEGKQERGGANCRHHQVDMPRMAVAGIPMARDDEDPRGERHQFPGKQEAEGISGDEDEVHCQGVSREERFDPRRQVPVAVKSHPVNGGGQHPEIHDETEEGRQGIELYVQPNDR